MMWTLCEIISRFTFVSRNAFGRLRDNVRPALMRQDIFLLQEMRDE